jgi:hypothetical protein
VCFAATNFALGDAETRAILFGAGVVSPMVAHLKRHAQSVDISTMVCGALLKLRPAAHDITHYNSEEYLAELIPYAAELRRAGVEEALVEVLKHHQNEYFILTTATKLVSSLARIQQCAVALVQAGVVLPLLAVLKGLLSLDPAEPAAAGPEQDTQRDTTSWRVMVPESACRALEKLAEHADNRKAMLPLGTLAVLHATAARFATQASVVQYANNAIANLTKASALASHAA